MHTYTLRAVLCGILILETGACVGLDETPKTSCVETADCLAGASCQDGMCVAGSGDAMLTTSVSGSVEGDTPTLIDAAFIPGSKCGIYLASAGNSLATCQVAQLKQSIHKPYLQINLTATAVGTYSLDPSMSCTGAPFGRGCTATFDGETTSSDDALSGSIEIVNSSATLVSGRYDLTFTKDGTTSAGHLQGSFVAHACK